MDIIRMLLEQRDVLKKSNQISFLWEEEEIFYAVSEKGDIAACGKEWAYLTEDEKLMSEFYSDGSQRERLPEKKQKIEMLYLVPGRIKLEEYDTNPYLVKHKIPLPVEYEVKQVVCQEEVFTISSKKGNADISGAFDTITRELSAAEYAYYGGGVAVNVLNRCYYEFLVEGHQLYLEEEERRRRRKPPKNLEKKKIKKTDFYQEENGDYTCECKISLWGVTTEIYANYGKNIENEDETLTEIANQLNLHIKWIGKNKKQIQKAILDYGMVELANDWMEGWEVTEDDGKNYYELEDGELFPCPVTEKVFLKGLYIQGINVYCSSKAPKEMSFDMFVGTTPDFFADHSIEVFITATAEGEYEVKIGGLAG